MSNVWCADETFLGDLIFLGRENLVVDSPGKEMTRVMREQLLAGKSPAAVISSDALNIPLSSVHRISTDRHDEDIEIEYTAGKEKKEKTLRLKSPEKRDEVFAALKEACGDRFDEFEEEYNRPQAMLAPLVSFTVFADLTLLLASAATDMRDGAEYEIEGNNQGAKAIFGWVLEMLGPIGIWLIGGILILLSAMAVFNAAVQPPVMVTLQRPPYRKKSNVALVFKYAILAFFMFLGFRLIQFVFLD